ncbi:hypothetical protein [Phenylobacterium sp.]|uniref:hypothetical protein n=1 Tax=Phenylobacterium sp. TaxID=1871053 RepID=UPI001227E378|nr:hypothetical protein [Phenylobacterium sp.]THD73124.1 MAG: hypothetical protein E8A12_00315 [Phenylobacterium sp.]
MTVAAFHIVRPTNLLGFAAPFLALAIVAFLAGFGGYLILGPANVLGMSHGAPTASGSAATPADVYLAPADHASNPPKAV